jgi:hypothetical protein
MIIELFDAWDRHQDALHLMKRLADDCSLSSLLSNGSSQDAQAAIHIDKRSLLTSSQLAANRADTAENGLTPAERILQMEGGIRLEQMALRLLDLLLETPEDNLVDIVRTRHALVSIYAKSVMSDKARETFAEAKDSVILLCRLHCHKSKEFFTAATDLAEYGMENAYTNDSLATFEELESEAVATFGADHPYTISLLIRIGKIIQKLDSWDNAQRYFEQAYAACITAFDFGSFITLRLERALERAHYPDGLDDDGFDKKILEPINL